jgi:Zn-dependent protease with chaperone function
VRKRFWPVIAGVLLCAACAMPSSDVPTLSKDDIAAERRRQEIAQLRDYYAQVHRVDSVAYRILTANRRYCKKWVVAQTGMIAATPQSLPKKYRKFSATALGLRWVRPTVISVAEGSPAALAGIIDKDELVSFNNEPIPVTATFRWINAFMEENEERPVKVVLRRGDEEKTFVMTPVIGCAIPITFEIDPTPNSFTDYSKIAIQSGILRVTRSDADLAIVLGHELAHVTMGHYDKTTINGLVGMAGGLVIDGGFLLGGMWTGGAFGNYLHTVGMMAFSVGFEMEADYVGAYYAARAGYDISGAAEVWRAYSLEVPSSIGMKSDHPTSPVRFLQMAKTIEEIADKQRRHLPLEPNLKEKHIEIAAPAAAPEDNGRP